MMKRLHIVLGALALAVAGGAQAIPLTDLLNGGSITVNDKLFDQWTEYSDPNRTTINTDNIEVTALADGGSNPGPGLQFTVLNGELDLTGDGIYAYIDYMFGFRVSTLGGQALIKDNSLALTGHAINYDPAAAVSFASVGIVENVYADANLTQLLATKDVVVDSLGAMTVSSSASFTPPVSELWVTKNILLEARDVTDTASLTGFEQRFSQTVPEPATLALLGLGLVGFGFRRLGTLSRSTTKKRGRNK